MHKFLWAMLLLLFLCLPGPARAGTFSDPDHACSFDLSDDWLPMAPSDIEPAVRACSPDPDLHCFAGFNRGTAGGERASAILLLSASPYPEDAEYDDLSIVQIQKIAAALTAVHPGEFHTATIPVIPRMAADTARQITCFTQPPGFAIDYLDLKDNVRSHSVAFIGRQRLVMLHFFTAPGDYQFLKRSADEIATSFRFDSSQALAIRIEAPGPDPVTTWAVYGFVAMLLAAAAYIVRYLFKRKAY